MIVVIGRIIPACSHKVPGIAGVVNMNSNDRKDYMEIISKAYGNQASLSRSGKGCKMGCKVGCKMRRF